MEKPEQITKTDWNILIGKYKDNLEFLKQKLDQNYPIQYLIGHIDFYGNPIKCDERAFIPRFETELLVSKTAEYINKLDIKYPKILEIGTGTGCIAISLAKLVPNANITALDINSKALELAQENADLNSVKINFLNQDILKDFDLSEYDVIVSNPPYVTKDEFIGEETKYEPQNALFTNDQEGLEFYEKIISQKPNSAKLLAFEIGAEQGEALKNISQRYFPGNNLVLEQDLVGRDRYFFIINE